MTLEIFIIASAVVLIGAISQGLIGVGITTLAAPLFFLIEPDLVPAPLIMADLIHTFLSAWRERGDINFPVVGWMLTGTVPGIIAGALITGVLAEAALGALVACIILCAVGLLAAGYILPQTKPASIGAGTAAGFSSAATSIAGPMASLYLARLSGPELRSTMGTYFLITSSISLAALTLLTEFTARQFAGGLLLVPAVVIGFLLSSPLRRFVDGGLLLKLIMAASSISAVVLLIRSVA